MAISVGCALHAVLADPAETLPAPQLVQTSASAATWRVLIEPQFMRPPVIHSIPGAQSTILAAAWVDADAAEIHYFRQDELSSLGAPDWTAFSAKAQTGASAELALLKPEYVRDKNQVIECAILRSDRQTTSSAVLAPEFLKHFEDVFGAKLIIAVPNRFTIYVFPSLASRYRDYGAQVISEYNASTYPVSREVFELSAQGLRAVGVFERQ